MSSDNFKNINIGALIRQKVLELDIEQTRICNFLKCTENDINEIYTSRNLDTETLLKWCKLLKYDFFRIYSQHLILYSPAEKAYEDILKPVKSDLPIFRKNIYTKEIIDFLLDLIKNGEIEMTKLQVITEYGIPKTTLYKWLQKY